MKIGLGRLARDLVLELAPERGALDGEPSAGETEQIGCALHLGIVDLPVHLKARSEVNAKPLSETEGGMPLPDEPDSSVVLLRFLFGFLLAGILSSERKGKEKDQRR
jgi:hypothetical protein